VLGVKTHTLEDRRTCFIHNKWRFDNVVLSMQEPTRVIGFLDWKLATLGDPLMDLAACGLATRDNLLLRAAQQQQPTHMPGILTRSEVVELYLRAVSKSITGALYEVFGLFRLAVIAQQITTATTKRKRTTKPSQAVGRDRTCGAAQPPSFDREPRLRRSPAARALRSQAANDHESHRNVAKVKGSDQK
jgi:aminoglycoside phosphotransferase (APT) family kinase protein